MSDAPPEPAARSSRVEVVDVPTASRYEARLVSDAGVPSSDVAIAMYERRPGRIAFLHTVVPTSMEGRGVASQIARFALDAARREGLAVLPRCPFFGAFIQRHHEYLDLVPEPMRPRLLGANQQSDG